MHGGVFDNKIGRVGSWACERELFSLRFKVHGEAEDRVRVRKCAVLRSGALREPRDGLHGGPQVWTHDGEYVGTRDERWPKEGKFEHEG